MPLRIFSGKEPVWQAVLAHFFSDVSITFGGIGIIWSLFYHELDVLAMVLGAMLFVRLDYDFLGIYAIYPWSWGNYGSSGSIHWTLAISKMINAWGMVAMFWLMGYYKCQYLIGAFGFIVICQLILERRWGYIIIK